MRTSPGFLQMFSSVTIQELALSTTIHLTATLSLQLQVSWSNVSIVPLTRVQCGVTSRAIGLPAPFILALEHGATYSRALGSEQVLIITVNGYPSTVCLQK